MNGPLSFKAQALDNTSPDHYRIGNENLPHDDQKHRRQITNLISEVAREGSYLLKSNGAELIIHHRRFLAQVYSVQLDQAGRRAPILCCGKFGKNDNPQVESAFIVQAIEAFAAEIGRTVEPEHARAIVDTITKLKKRNQSRRFVIGIGIMVLLMALIFAVPYL